LSVSATGREEPIGGAGGLGELLDELHVLLVADALAGGDDALRLTMGVSMGMPTVKS
jgi:hypothetical protein